MREKNIFCCSEHMDMAFDDFLVENETFPNLEETTNNKCSYCDNDAIYILKAPSENK